MTRVADNCDTSQTPTRLPSLDELKAATEALGDISSLTGHIQWCVQRIARGAAVEDFPELALVQGDEIPTYAHIGQLYLFVSEARFTLREIESHLQTIEDKLYSLDTVRAMAEVDDA